MHGLIDYLNYVICMNVFSYFDHILIILIILIIFKHAKFMRNLPRKAKATPSPQD